MTGHTPGPWESHHQKMDSIDHEWSLQTTDHAFLLFNFSPTLSPGECKANARLIAAAPDMLAALKTAFLLPRPWTVGARLITEEKWNAAVDAVTSAIAKAEGHPSR